jgi:hypothetical protein
MGKGMPAERQAAKPSRQRRPRRAPRPLYAGVMVGVVVFVSGLLVLPPSPTWHEAQVTIVCSDAKESAKAAAAIRGQLADDDAARKLLNQWGPPPGSSASVSKDWPPYSEIERLRQAVRIATAEEGDVPHVTLAVIDANRKRALLVAERLADAAGGSPPISAASAPIDPAVQSQLEALKSQEQQARARLDAFLKRHFNQSLPPTPGDDADRASESKTSKREASPAQVGKRQGIRHRPFIPNVVLAQFEVPPGGQSLPSAAALASRQTENPEWIKLKQDHDAQIAQRARMLQRMTPVHPQVLALEAEIERLRRLLENTPRYDDPRRSPAAAPVFPAPVDSSPLDAPSVNPAPIVNPYSPHADPSTKPPPGVTPSDPSNAGGSNAGASNVPEHDLPAVDPELLAAHASQYNALRRSYEQARRALAEAEALVKKLAAQPPAVSNVALTHTADEPQIVRSQGGEPSKAGVVMLGLLALVAGGATAWACRGASPNTNTFASAEEAGRELGLPLIGDIQRAAGAPSKPRASLRQSIAVRAVRVAELLLVVFGVGFLIVSMIDSPLVLQALQSPLSAASRIMQRLTELI